MKIGFHIPFSGNLQTLKKRIVISRGNTFQIFSRGLRGGNVQKINLKQMDELQGYFDKKRISQVIVHAPYVYNLAQENSPDVDLILEDLELANKFKAPFYVIHPGYSKELHPFVAMENVKNNLKQILKETDWYGYILIKNMAGAGTEFGYDLTQWNELLSFHPHVKGALDFARMFASGHDFTSEAKMKVFYEEMEETIGWEKIKVLYINDTNRFCGSKKNDKKPPSLGQGNIGFRGYESILSREVVQSKIWLVENINEPNEYDKSINQLLKFF